MKRKFWVLAVVLLAGMSHVAAEEILLGKYDFSTKSTVPVEQAPGVVFGTTFGVWNSSLYDMNISVSDDGYLLVRCYGAGVASNRYGYFSITPDLGKTVKITKVKIKHFKVEGSNTNRTRCYLYDMGGDTPKENPSIVSNLIYAGNGGAIIPSDLTEQTYIPSASSEFNSVRFMSLVGTQNTNDNEDLSQWKIQSLELYGEIFSPGDIVVTSSVDFGNVLAGNSADGAVSLKVMGGIDKNVDVELIDPDFAFTCLQSIVEPIDATAGTSVRVSFTPSTPGKHTAQLKFSYDDKEAYTELTGVCPVLNETFTYFVSDPDLMAELDSTQINDYSQESYLTMPGWMFTDSVFWHLSGSWGLGLELRGSATEAAVVKTPELDLSAPFGVSFRSKKMSNLTTTLGNMYALVDSDTIWSFVNPNNTLTARSVDGFVATSASYISFMGLADDSSRVVVDEISVFPTTNPALNLPAYMAEAFTPEDEPVTISIPFRAYQLTGDMEVVLSGAAPGYEVLTPSIAQATAEAGTDIQVKYTKPQDGAAVNAVVEVKGGGITDYRYISLINNLATGFKPAAINASVYGKEGAVVVFTGSPAGLELYGLDGKAIYRSRISGGVEVAVRPGIYMVRLTDDSGVRTEKVFVR